jgi:hypothetical protein
MDAAWVCEIRIPSRGHAAIAVIVTVAIAGIVLIVADSAIVGIAGIGAEHFSPRRFLRHP